MRPSMFLRIQMELRHRRGIDALLSVKEDGMYVGSSGGHPNTCYCNTVFYSTLAACAYCQDVLNPSAIQTYVSKRSRFPSCTQP